MSKKVEDNIGTYFVINDVLEPAKKINSIDILSNKPVYEVIRVIDGVPLFFEDHYLRLANSCNMLGHELKTAANDLRSQILKLTGSNMIKNCNVKILVFSGHDSEKCVLYVRRSYYPTMEDIEKGARVSILHAERENPHVKQVNTGYKEKTIQKMAETNSFEVLLVNKDNKITEGSRSNVFFVKGQKVCTAPEEYILKGVTRKYIIDTCTRNGIQVVETLVDADSLEEFEGLFISGTSINVFPVSHVDDLDFKSFKCPIINTVREQFDRLIKEYIEINSFRT